MKDVTSQDDNDVTLNSNMFFLTQHIYCLVFVSCLLLSVFSVWFGDPFKKFRPQLYSVFTYFNQAQSNNSLSYFIPLSLPSLYHIHLFFCLSHLFSLVPIYYILISLCYFFSALVSNEIYLCLPFKCKVFFTAIIYPRLFGTILSLSLSFKQTQRHRHLH